MLTLLRSGQIWLCRDHERRFTCTGESASHPGDPEGFYQRNNRPAYPIGRFGFRWCTVTNVWRRTEPNAESNDLITLLWDPTC